MIFTVILNFKTHLFLFILTTNLNITEKIKIVKRKLYIYTLKDYFKQKLSTYYGVSELTACVESNCACVLSFTETRKRHFKTIRI